MGENAMSWNEFLMLLGIETINIHKGKGRRFARTKVGMVLFGEKTSLDKPLYVGMAGEGVKSESGESLAGTIWAFNSKSELVATLGKQ